MKSKKYLFLVLLTCLVAILLMCSYVAYADEVTNKNVLILNIPLATENKTPQPTELPSEPKQQWQESILPQTEQNRQNSETADAMNETTSHRVPVYTIIGAGAVALAVGIVFAVKANKRSKSK